MILSKNSDTDPSTSSRFLSVLYYSLLFSQPPCMCVHHGCQFSDRKWIWVWCSLFWPLSPVSTVCLSLLYRLIVSFLFFYVKCMWWNCTCQKTQPILYISCWKHNNQKRCIFPFCKNYNEKKFKLVNYYEDWLVSRREFKNLILAWCDWWVFPDFPSAFCFRVFSWIFGSEFSFNSIHHSIGARNRWSYI